MRRICYVIDELRVGGTESHVLQLIQNLDRSRVEPYLCLLDGQSETSRSLEPKATAILRLGIQSLASWKAIRTMYRFREWLRANRIDIVQTFFPDSTYFGILTGWLAGVPILLKSRRDLEYWVTGKQRRLGRWIDRWYNRFFVDAMVSNCQACLDSAYTTEPPLPPQTVVIPNGIQVDTYVPCRRTPQADGELTVGILAMLRPEKRVDLFAMAAVRLINADRPYRFLIGGDGSERKRLQSIVADCDRPSQIEFCGVVRNKIEFLKRVDLAVNCSDTEGLANAMIEYIAAGKPLVATSVGGNCDLVFPGKNGILVEPGNDIALSQAIDDCLQAPQQLEEWGQFNVDFAQQFSMDRVMEQYHALYESFPEQTAKSRPSAVTSSH